jgi:hypothetical protein
MDSALCELEVVLARRLPISEAAGRSRLAVAYLQGVRDHALERTVGSGPVPTALSMERSGLIAHVCRALQRVLTEEEIGALLRVPAPAARSLRKTMLAVYDDVPQLSLRAAFEGAVRDGRGSAGAITDGYRVKFASAERMELAQTDLERQGFGWEAMRTSATVHVLLIDSRFALPDLPGR